MLSFISKSHWKVLSLEKKGEHTDFEYEPLALA